MSTYDEAVAAVIAHPFTRPTFVAGLDSDGEPIPDSLERIDCEAVLEEDRELEDDEEVKCHRAAHDVGSHMQTAVRLGRRVVVETWV